MPSANLVTANAAGYAIGRYPAELLSIHLKFFGPRYSGFLALLASKGAARVTERSYRA